MTEHSLVRPRGAVDPLLALSAARIAAAVNDGDPHGRRGGRGDAGPDRNEPRGPRLDHRPARTTRFGELVSARPGPLAGFRWPFKDIFDTAGVRTTYGSVIFADHVPRRTATAVARLEAAGAIVGARRTCTSSPTASPARTRTGARLRIPVLPGRVAGGSSGGTAAALADYQADHRPRLGHGRVDPHPGGPAVAWSASSRLRCRPEARLSFRSRRRSTRSARWPGRWPTWPSLTRC